MMTNGRPLCPRAQRRRVTTAIAVFVRDAIHLLRHGVLLVALTAGGAKAADNVVVEITGSPTIMFDTAIDGCAPIDMPDVNARAFRDAAGRMVMFALHDVNRPLRGPDLAHLKIDCHVALDSPLDANPAHYADRNFITATWTRDGTHVSALVHHEYHADDFKACRVPDTLGCWYNSILAYRSNDGGKNFARSDPPIVAAAPFRQDVEQGRHRGFFNPSNIVADGRYVYTFISTTGWDTQPYGNCLFRTDDPARPDSWRAFDGKSFSVGYEDPYKVKTPRARPCSIIGPFTFPVGAIVRHRTSRSWIAFFQASSGRAFPADGFYYATSRDLLNWGPPKLLLTGHTLYGDLCKAGSSIINYPSVIDSTSTGRNFDEVGDHPDLLFVRMDIANCRTGSRLLVREGLTVRLDGKS